MLGNIKLELSRPLISFDLETTGLDLKKDKIVSISAFKFFPDGTYEDKYYLINPNIPIPEASSKVHGITDEMVKDAPLFSAMAKNMFIWFGDSDLMGFNILDYDIPLLGREFYDCGLNWKIGQVIDVMKVERKFNAHNLMATYERYMGKKFDGAHNSRADNIATVEIFNAMTEKYQSLPNSVGDIHKMVLGDKLEYADFSRVFYWKDGYLYWNINPKKDTKVIVGDNFNSWFAEKDFSKQSKDILYTYLKDFKK